MLTCKGVIDVILNEFLKCSRFVSNMAFLDKYNSHKQNLFESSIIFKSVKRVLRPKIGEPLLHSNLLDSFYFYIQLKC